MRRKTNPKANQTKSKADQATCPICGTTFDRGASSSYPFCSPRCRTIDLGRWLDGKYVISRPIEHSDLDEGE